MQSEERDAIRQNLIACNCDADMIDRFMVDMDAGKVKDALRLLEKQRRKLLDRFHQYNEQIGCLDYLVYQIEKQCEESA